MTPIKENLKGILKGILPIIFTLNLGFIAISFITKSWTYCFSSILGSTFSFMALHQLIRSQEALLNQGKTAKGLFFYFLRLATFAIPIILSLKHDKVFNIWVVIGFLFSFQFTFIVTEAVKRYRKIKGTKSR
ncbi:hypothetical protein DID77_03160 [Candidatus Marinamargulisbacteria bacterium SCGC AG-439-L15]|nr:hypothetical protein DID77_03160 [Candidatus Marinamargulisbacteria bacterium SCGC AG-439-L15]